MRVLVVAQVFMISFLLAPAIGWWCDASTAADDTVRPVTSVMEIRRHNVVLQQWELSCAAAALATVLRYQHGVPFTERSVALGLINRQEYLENPELVRLRQGFSLLDLKRFVDGLGFEGIGLGQLAFSDLLERAPIIVPVNLNGYPHFVVFRGATQNRVLLADPAFGNVTMLLSRFIDGWIDYRDIHHVGFVVTKSGTLASPGLLLARAHDFVMFR
ncbi:MAG: C39 family peptidase [Candidatus Bathyarchaeota archaeon]|nr:C39 family peptidase [Candidatus Bathyarchaeota archaeon]